LSLIELSAGSGVPTLAEMEFTRRLVERAVQTTTALRVPPLA
jgi:hypothetical protein